MLVPSYKFEYLVGPPVLEDGASFLAPLPVPDSYLSSWGPVIHLPASKTSFCPSLLSASSPCFSPAGPKGQQGGGDC